MIIKPISVAKIKPIPTSHYNFEATSFSDSISVFYLYCYFSEHEIYKPLQWWLLCFWIIINFEYHEKEVLYSFSELFLEIKDDVASEILQSKNSGK